MKLTLVFLFAAVQLMMSNAEATNKKVKPLTPDEIRSAEDALAIQRSMSRGGDDYRRPRHRRHN